MGKYLNKKNRAIFLDRDGIINKSKIVKGKPFPPLSLEEFEFNKGIKIFINTLDDKKFKKIIITNQPDFARGKTSKKNIEDIHAFILKHLSIDEIYTCWDSHDGVSDLKKPSPGLILKAAKEHNISLKDSYMVGDRWKDIDAGSRAGCTTIFVDYHYDEELNITPDHVISDIREALKIIN